MHEAWQLLWFECTLAYHSFSISAICMELGARVACGKDETRNQAFMKSGDCFHLNERSVWLICMETWCLVCLFFFKDITMHTHSKQYSQHMLGVCANLSRLWWWNSRSGCCFPLLRVSRGVMVSPVAGPGGGTPFQRCPPQTRWALSSPFCRHGAELGLGWRKPLYLRRWRRRSHRRDATRPVTSAPLAIPHPPPYTPLHRRYSLGFAVREHTQITHTHALTHSHTLLLSVVSYVKVWGAQVWAGLLYYVTWQVKLNFSSSEQMNYGTVVWNGGEIYWKPMTMSDANWNIVKNKMLKICATQTPKNGKIIKQLIVVAPHRKKGASSVDNCRWVGFCA